MKIPVNLFAGLLLLVSCQNNMHQNEIQILVQNTLDKAREDDLVVLTRANLYCSDSVFNAEIPNLKTKAGKQIPVQIDDLDQDGKWDELSFLWSMEAKKTDTLTLSFSDKGNAPAYPIRSNAYLGYAPTGDSLFKEVNKLVLDKNHEPQEKPAIYQFEGPGWENDKVAFRLYFDKRNGKDVFGKRKPDMVLPKIGLPGTRYDQLCDWGADILKVGNSLGAGSLAIISRDSMYGLGAVAQAEYILLAEGPVRAVFQLRYTGWNVNNKIFNLTDQISIWGGSYCYKSSVTLSGDFGESILVTGISNLNLPAGKKSFQLDSLPNYQVLATYGLQTVINGELGMAILANNTVFKGIGETLKQGSGKEIDNTYYMKLDIKKDKPTEFYFFSCWELTDPGFKAQEGFVNELRKTVEKLNNPLRINIRSLKE